MISEDEPDYEPIQEVDDDAVSENDFEEDELEGRTHKSVDSDDELDPLRHQDESDDELDMLRDMDEIRRLKSSGVEQRTGSRHIDHGILEDCSRWISFPVNP
jgi:hypothetical protein